MAKRHDVGGGTLSVEGLTRLADVPEERTEWLYENRIPIGELTIVEGDPGTNKSSLCCDLAARLSQGITMPGATQRGRPRKGGSLFLIGEDSISKTVVGRLRAAGADLNKVAVLDDVVIPGDIERIEEAIREIGATLVVVDTITDFLSGSVLNNQAVRKALRPLREMAERTGAAVVMLRHFNKKSSGRSLHRGGGSVAITAMARGQLKLYKHPTDEHLRVLVQDKSNLGLRAPALLFEVVSADDGQFRLECRGETNLTVADLEGSKDGRPKLEAAKTFLQEKLADGPKDVNWLIKNGPCSKRTLDEAKKSLELVTKREGKGKHHIVSWALPAGQKKRQAKTAFRAKKPGSKTRASKKPASKTRRAKSTKVFVPKASELDPFG